MSQKRSMRVRKILQLEGRGAALLGSYEGHLARIVPTRHRAEQLFQEARAIKAKLAPWELAELRRARSGV
jgi:hypothetical protein